MSDQSDEQSGEERGAFLCWNFYKPEKQGYVHRKEDPADRRNKQVYLTPEGEEFKEQIRPILDQVYVYAEQVIGIESIELMLSELKGVYDVLENV